MTAAVHKFHVVIEIVGDTGDDFRIVQERYERAVKKLNETPGIDYVEQIGYALKVIDPLAKGK